MRQKTTLTLARAAMTLASALTRRTAAVLAIAMLTTATAWATTKTVTYTISYNKETNYWLDGSDNTHYNIGSSIGMAKTYTMPMGDDMTITITSAGDHCSISYYARNESIDGFSYYDYTFTFASSTYYITNVKIKDLVKRHELSVDNDTKECTVNWNHHPSYNVYADAQQIEVTLSDTKPLFYYDITYKLNGGTNATGNPQSYEKSAGVASFAAATRTGYTFGGWYDNSECTGDAVTSIAAGSMGKKTLYAKWTANTYSVVFNANGGTGTMSNQPLTYDAAAQALTANDFTREGHSFNGWNTAANGSGTGYANGASVSNLTSEQGAIVNLYAQWTVLDYQVTFDANGHGTAPTAQTVTYGTKATEPTALTADGWIFGGWYRENTCENRWEFGADNVTGATTLYAKWDQDAFTITYVLDGGVNSASNPLIYKKSSGETITLADPTKTGYTFKGWTPDNGEISSGSEGNKTFTATWQVNQYTITFDTDGGKLEDGTLATIAPITQDYGTAVTAPTAKLAKKGYLFNGWADLPATMPGENITVYPSWTRLYHHNQVEPTCTEIGSMEHYYGNNKDWTENIDGLTYSEINTESLIIPAIGHTWSDTPQWTWYYSSGELVAEFKLVCTKCGYPMKTYATTFAQTQTLAPTETKDGVMSYTATIDAYYSYTGKTYTDTYQEAIPRLFKVAKIGETEYSYLKDAMDAATSGDVITLYGNVIEPETFCGGYSKDIVLDLNGHTVLIDKINNDNNLTVKNGSLVCNIDNANSGGDKTLTLDNAELTCVGVYNSKLDVWFKGIEWLAKNIAVTNGSEMYIYGSTYLGGGADDGFNLTIDGTSCVILENATLSGYNDTRVRSQFAQYLPIGYAINGEGKVTYGGSEYTDPVTLSPSTITLVDNADNRTAITANYGYEKNVQLSGRTLTKDGNWNTLVLPFVVTAAQIAVEDHPLHGATIMELDNSDNGTALSNAGVLTLKFSTVTAIEAGKPYIVKWDGASGTVSAPVFNGVIITSTTPTAIKSNDNKVTFVGQYSPFTIDNDNIKSVIMLGSGSQLGYSQNARTLKCFRAHFEVSETANVREFVLDFGDETTGIVSISKESRSQGVTGAWYTIDGRKLDGKPTQKGMYIHNGRKEVVK